MPSETGSMLWPSELASCAASSSAARESADSDGASIASVTYAIFSGLQGSRLAPRKVPGAPSGTVRVAREQIEQQRAVAHAARYRVIDAEVARAWRSRRAARVHGMV